MSTAVNKKTDSGASGDDSTQAEPSPHVQTNEEIINEIIGQHAALDLNDDKIAEPDATTVEEAEHLTPEDLDAEEESRREHEKTLTPKQLEDNKQKSIELKVAGNALFKNEKYTESIESYTAGLDICPLSCTEDRSVLFGNRAAAYIQVANKTLAIQDCTNSLKLNPKYTKVLLRRAKLYEETDKLDESLQDFKDVLLLDSQSSDAHQALVRLPPKIDARNEAMKEEMLGKLKDLGNMILRPFGLSTNNFQMQKDPNSGSYSVNFNQNPGK